MLSERAARLREYLLTHPLVRSCTPYGSLITGKADEYSDIDLALDVSGSDNGVFLLTLPGFLAEGYPVLYTDYAPSLAPEKYILTAALFPDDPFCLADISSTASPHCRTVTPDILRQKNDLWSHTLKVFTANLKHTLRGQDCGRDIRKMYSRLGLPETDNIAQMLEQTCGWLTARAPGALSEYVHLLEPHLTKLL